LGLAANKLSDLAQKEGNLKPAFITARKQLKSSALLSDLVLLSRSLGLACTDTIHIQNLLFETLSVPVEGPSLSSVAFKECYFARVEIETGADGNTPSFEDCLIHEIDGRVSLDDLPAGKFRNTEVEVFLDGTLTTDSISKLAVSDGVKVLLSVLKKLFVQSLSGRKQQALFRGLDSARQVVVPGVLSLLQRHNVITKSGRAGEPIWLPVRRQRARVLAILQAPSTSGDHLLTEAASLL
jgi:hypothetical protein